MTLLVVPVLLAWLAWRGAPWPSLALIAAGWAVHASLLARLLRATLTPAGGHAEWVRERSLRPRLRRSPLWAVGWLLVIVGVALAFAS